MDRLTSYTDKLLEQNRECFEVAIWSKVEQRNAYRPRDELLKVVTKRGLDGDYLVEWVSNAWLGFKMAHDMLCSSRDKHTSIPGLPGLYWLFGDATLQPIPVVVDAAEHHACIKTFDGQAHDSLSESEYLVGPQALPSAGLEN